MERGTNYLSLGPIVVKNSFLCRSWINEVASHQNYCAHKRTNIVVKLGSTELIIFHYHTIDLKLRVVLVYVIFFALLLFPLKKTFTICWREVEVNPINATINPRRRKSTWVTVANPIPMVKIARAILVLVETWILYKIYWRRRVQGITESLAI